MYIQNLRFSATPKHWCRVKKNGQTNGFLKDRVTKLQNSNNLGKSNYFSTKSIFKKLVLIIDELNIKEDVKMHAFDRYVKRFKSKKSLYKYVVFVVLPNKKSN